MTDVMMVDLRNNVREPSVQMISTRDHLQALEPSRAPALSRLQGEMFVYLRTASQAMWDLDRMLEENQRVWQMLATLSPQSVKGKGRGRSLGKNQPPGTLTNCVRRALQTLREELRERQMQAAKKKENTVQIKGSIEVEKWKCTTTTSFANKNLDVVLKRDEGVQEQLDEMKNDVDQMKEDLKAAKKERVTWRKRREELERSSQVANIHTRQIIRPCSTCTHKVRSASDKK